MSTKGRHVPKWSHVLEVHGPVGDISKFKASDTWEHRWIEWDMELYRQADTHLGYYLDTKNEPATAFLLKISKDWPSLRLIVGYCQEPGGDDDEWHWLEGGVSHSFELTRAEVGAEWYRE